MPTCDESFKTVSSLFGVLGHPDRLKILSLLKQAEMDVSHLQQELGISQSGVSQHLSQLKSHGLVDQRREGKHVFYRLKSSEIALILASTLQLLAADLAGEGALLSAVSEMLSLLGV